ncbi:hypothetical protein DDT46_02845 [Mycobacteroides abscessus]|nr:hypothetical protein DDT46_02845 [Mycobacteroides abscessus]PVB11957.1 hypothetical protein DDJ40_16465 [Mycobacteroides abscessus]PVB16650.1 hypothetical protein DDJ71_21100 [Mycobacteroides abscessus]RIR41899.1 hypothetical protein D2E39_20520 [Mycobacteroides abscessus]RIU20260.1 hypothetical protein D2E89_15730 [Mycobacteroides abscessus]
MLGVGSLLWRYALRALKTQRPSAAVVRPGLRAHFLKLVPRADEQPAGMLAGPAVVWTTLWASRRCAQNTMS